MGIGGPVALGSGLWSPAVPGSREALSHDRRSHSPPFVSKEEDFLRPTSREEAQKLWEMERAKMRQMLDKQQKQMVEDYQWLKQEEKSLVSGLSEFSQRAGQAFCDGTFVRWKCRFVKSKMF